MNAVASNHHVDGEIGEVRSACCIETWWVAIGLNTLGRLNVEKWHAKCIPQTRTCHVAANDHDLGDEV